MGNKVPWKTGMLIYLPVTLRTLISLQKEAVLSPCNFATAYLTGCILNFYLPYFATPWMEDPFATSQYWKKEVEWGWRSLSEEAGWGLKSVLRPERQTKLFTLIPEVQCFPASLAGCSETWQLKLARNGIYAVQLVCTQREKPSTNPSFGDGLSEYGSSFEQQAHSERFGPLSYRERTQEIPVSLRFCAAMDWASFLELSEFAGELRTWWSSHSVKTSERRKGVIRYFIS